MQGIYLISSFWKIILNWLETWIIENRNDKFKSTRLLKLTKIKTKSLLSVVLLSPEDHWQSLQTFLSQIEGSWKIFYNAQDSSLWQRIIWPWMPIVPQWRSLVLNKFCEISFEAFSCLFVTSKKQTNKT